MKTFAVGVASLYAETVSIQGPEGYGTLIVDDATVIIGTTIAESPEEAVNKVAQDSFVPKGMLIALELTI